ncbi:MAG: hypothetical protein PHP92_03995 [Candidatus Nanoarchaeia archaeon]|nr:hypothetical protein [Candidatus Nanoarchaeia archaeon]
MKIRNQFVSNSSSTSFIISHEGLTKKQINEISNLLNDMEEKDTEGETMVWRPKNINVFYGEMSQNDADKLIEKLEKIGVKEENFEFNS